MPNGYHSSTSRIYVCKSCHSDELLWETKFRDVRCLFCGRITIPEVWRKKLCACGSRGAIRVQHNGKDYWRCTGCGKETPSAFAKFDGSLL